ncbi:uncharacterized protein VP01_9147g1, partial [Puccinia sorghi]
TLTTGPTPSLNGPAPSPKSSFSNLPVNLQGGIQALLAAFFDPEARKTCNMESSMSQFYAAQYQEATTQINHLQDENH